MITAPAGRRLAAGPTSTRPRISRASRPPTVADAGTDGQGSPRRLDCTGTHGCTESTQPHSSSSAMRFHEACRPEANCSSRRFHRPEVFPRTAAWRSAAALTGHARNSLLGLAVGPRDRIGKSRLPPRHLRPRRRADSMPSRLRRRWLSNSRGPRAPTSAWAPAASGTSSLMRSALPVQRSQGAPNRPLPSARTDTPRPSSPSPSFATRHTLVMGYPAFDEPGQDR